MVAGLAVRFVGSPVLVRFPVNTDQKLQYTGTATVYTSPSTMLPLATPIKVPLSIERTIKVKSASYSQVVVDETINMTFAGTTRTEAYQYVMNRRSMQLLDSSQSFAFGKSSNTMSPAGSYRINLPMGTSSSRDYTAWAPETDSAITITPTGPAHHSLVADTQVITFRTNLDHTVAPYYLAYLQSEGLPTKLAAGTVTAELQAHGANPTQVLAAVAPHLTTTQLAALEQAFSQPVPLTYSYFQQGQISVQPSTGAIVDASSAREGVSVAPNLSGFAGAAAALAPYASLPAVQKVAAAVTAMSAPQVVMQLTYSQTTASARSVTATADHQADLMALLQWQLPLGLVVLGLVALVAAWLWPERSQAQITVLPAGAPPSHTHGGWTSLRKHA